MRPLLLLVLVLVSCRFELERTLAPGELRGRVEYVAAGSDETPRAAEGARIRLLGTPLSTLADARGRFVLRGAPAGELRLRVEFLADGRELARLLPVALSADSSGTVRDARDLGPIRMNALAEVVGRVALGNVAIRGARVVAPGLGTATTGDDGTYRLLLPEGVFELAAIYPGDPETRVSVRAEVPVVGRTTVDFAAQQADPTTAQISGQVGVFGGGSAEGVSLRLVGGDGHDAWAGESNGGGLWFAGPLPVGAYRLEASGPGLRPGVLAPVAVYPDAVAPTLVLATEQGGGPDCDLDGVPDDATDDDDSDGLPDADDGCRCDAGGSVDANQDGVCDYLEPPPVHPDSTPPQVVFVTPAAAAVDVDPAVRTLRVEFDEPLDASVPPAALSTAPIAIASTAALEADGRTVVFTLAGDLPAATAMTVTVAGARDLAGNAMAAYSWSFTTAARSDVTPPQVVAVSPRADATGVATGLGALVIDFDEPMSSAQPAGVVTIRPGVEIVVQLATPTRLSASFSALLAPDTRYEVTITGAKDVAGNAMTPYQWSFTTATGGDATAPTITGTTPADDAVGVERLEALAISVDEPLAPASFAPFRLTLVTFPELVAVPGQASLDASGRRLTFVPAAALAAGVQYELGLAAGMTDLAGNELNGHVIRFRTRSADVALGSAHGYGISLTGTLYGWGTTGYDAQRRPLPTGTSHPTPDFGATTPWLAVSAGWFHTCAIDAQRALWCWGRNAHGTLGVGDTLDRSAPAQVAGAWKSVSAGARHTCARRTDDTLWCWGANEDGQVGTTPASAVVSPVQLLAPAAWQDVSAGDAHTCGRDALGEVWCWGANDAGQLGLGRPGGTDAPEQVPGGPYLDVGAGGRHSCAISPTHALSCWGRNASGQLGLGTRDRLEHGSPAPVAGAETFRSIELGGAHGCALSTAGFVHCWGRNDDGELGTGDSAPHDAPAMVLNTQEFEWIGAFAEGSCAVAAGSNDPVCWGNNRSGRLGISNRPLRAAPTPVPVPDALMGISAGLTHTCGHGSSGALWCWGDGSDGQLAPARTIEHLPASVGTGRRIFAGWDGTCLLDGAELLTCFGRNFVSQLGASPVPVLAPTAIPSAAAWLSIGLGEAHGCGVQATSQTAGELYCWGNDTVGQTGLGTGFYAEPTRVGLLSDWVDVFVGRSHTLALRSNGTLWGFGANGSGQLGAPVAASVPTPRQVGTEVWTQVTTGESHTCGIKLGVLHCWGENAAGQLGIGSFGQATATPRPIGNALDYMQISAGGDTTCAVRANNSLECWGASGSGQVGWSSLAPSPSPALVSSSEAWERVHVSPSTRGAHTCALTVSGGTFCWGANDDGQLGHGSSWSPSPAAVLLNSAS